MSYDLRSQQARGTQPKKALTPVRLHMAGGYYGLFAFDHDPKQCDFTVRFKHKAFISYKHEASTTFAENLELAIKSYAKPLWKPPISVFRDEKYLRPGIDLPGMIREHLDASEFLILLASPEASGSPWVRDELEQWCEQPNRLRKLIIVVTDGTIAFDQKTKQINWLQTTALPRFLKAMLHSLPLYVDLSWARNVNDQTILNPDYKNAVNAIVAALRNIDPIEMIGEEVKQHRRNIRTRNVFISTIIALAISLGIAAKVARDREIVAERNARVAVARQLATESRVALADHPQRALLLAAAAVDATKVDGSIETSAEVALRSGLSKIQGHPLVGTVDAATSIATNDKSSVLAAARDSFGLRIWRSKDAAKDGLRMLEDKNARGVKGLKLSSHGRWLFLLREDGTADLRDLSSAQLFERDTRITPEGGETLQVQFSVSENWLSTRETKERRTFNEQDLDQDGRLTGAEITKLAQIPKLTSVWRLSGEAPQQLSVPSELAQSQRQVFSPDESWLVTGGQGQSVRIWRLVENGPILSVVGPTSRALFRYPIEFSSTGRWLIAGGNPQEVRLWHFPPGGVTPIEVTFPKDVILSAVTEAKFSIDGKLIAVGMNDGSVRVWRLGDELELGRPIYEVKHKLPIQALFFSPDNNWLLVDPDSSAGSGTRVSAEVDEAPQLWDLRSPDKPRRQMISHVKASQFGFSADSSWLIAWSKAGQDAPKNSPSRLEVWELLGIGQSPNAVLRTSKTAVTHAQLMSGGTLLTAYLNGGLETQQLVAGELLPLPCSLLWHEAPITNIAIIRESRAILSGATDGTVALWHFGQRCALPANLRHRIEHPRDKIRDVLAVFEDRWLATQSPNMPARLHQVRNSDDRRMTKKSALFGNGYTANMITRSLSGRLLGAVGGVNELVVRAGPSRILIASVVPGSAEPRVVHVEDIRDGVLRLQFSSDDKHLVASLNDGGAKVWRISGDGARVDAVLEVPELGPHFLSPDGRWLATRQMNSTRLYDISAEAPALHRQSVVGEVVISQSNRLSKPFLSEIAGSPFSPDSKWLLVADDGESRLIRISNSELGRNVVVLGGLDEAIGRFAFSRDGRWLLTTSFHQAMLWRIEEDSPELRPRKISGTLPPDGFAFSADGRWLITSGSSTVLFDLERDDPIEKGLILADGPVEAVFSSDSCSVAALKPAGSTALWDLCDNDGLDQRILEVSAMDLSGGSVAFSPDSNMIAVGNQAGQIAIWKRTELTTAAPMFVEQHRAPIRQIGFMPGNRKDLVALDDRGAVLLWPLDLDILRDHVDTVVPRDFTREECGRYFVEIGILVERLEPSECRISTVR